MIEAIQDLRVLQDKWSFLNFVCLFDCSISGGQLSYGLGWFRSCIDEEVLTLKDINRNPVHIILPNDLRGLKDSIIRVKGNLEIIVL